MPHRLFIVARGHDHLYEDLRQQFAANPEVEVLVDRRSAERRQNQTRTIRSAGAASGATRARPAATFVSAGAVPGLPLLIVELAPVPAR